MSYHATVYKVMIASPSDVVAERSIIRDVLREWNIVHSENRRIVLLPVGWDTHSSPEMGATSRSSIKRQMLATSDMLIGVFWTRIGTPTDQYMSGTVEDIEEHIGAGKIAMLYFSSASLSPDGVDHEQYAKLKEFKKSCETRGLLEPYANLVDFKDKLYRHIQLQINNIILMADRRAEETYPMQNKKTPATMPKGDRAARTNVFVEPIPKGREGAIEGYVLELAGNARVNQTTYKTQVHAIKDAKSLGHKPLVARVRNTNKGNPDHWRSAD